MEYFWFWRPTKFFSKKFSEKSNFSTFGDAVFQNLHFEYASYGIKRCAEQFPTHNTMFLSYWVAKMCVQKLFASTFHRQCLGVFSEFFGDFLTTFTPPRVLFTAHFYHLKFPNQLQIRKNSENFQNVHWKAMNIHCNPTYIRSFFGVFWRFSGHIYTTHGTFWSPQLLPFDISE